MYLEHPTVPACYGSKSKHQSIMDYLFPITDVDMMDFKALGLGNASDYDVIDLVSSDEEVIEEEPTMTILDEEDKNLRMDPLDDEEEDVLGFRV